MFVLLLSPQLFCYLRYRADAFCSEFEVPDKATQDQSMLLRVNITKNIADSSLLRCCSISDHGFTALMDGFKYLTALSTIKLNFSS